ncbi:MAG: xanthine dehydrogenase family protein molybdopterin-binding subunit [Brucellaceae bacterium]|nr:xanthine dehydrogenase family protein molybdopterin-binding subunit [Brucellaceae bacterium]
MSRLGTITRRTLLVATAAIAGGVAVGYYFYRKPPENPLEAGLGDGEATFNPWITIGENNAITVVAPRAEMGQGVMTTLAALVCEELDVDLDQVEVVHGPPGDAYANIAMLEDGLPFPQFDDSVLAELARGSMAVVGKFLSLQVTGGSTSTVDAFEKMRLAGAAARETLKAAAASRLGVDAASLRTERGMVSDPASGKSLSYGELAAEAAGLDPPGDIALRPSSEWRLLGKPQPRVDMRAKVTGAPVFGVDVALPDMVHATIRMNPRLGGAMTSMDASAAEAMPGVIRVVPIEHRLGNGFAVIAATTWHAFQAAEKVEVEWGKAAYPADDEAMWRVLGEAASDGSPSAQRDDGDVEVEFADAAPEKLLDVEYRVPWLAHACMEPMNATAWLRDGALDVWAPNQSPGLVRTLCADAAGVEEGACTVHTTLLGGGFGRRGDVDYAIFAAIVARHTDGKPVKVTWTREEDITHDMYRPAALGRFRARIGEDGLPMAVDMKIASPSIMASVLPRFFPSLSAMGPDKTITEGAFNQPYAIANYRVSGVKADLPVPVGFWRSVGNSINGYFHESFMDEIAEAGGVDPVELRRKLMAPWPTAAKLVDKVAEMSNWSEPAANGRAKGFAFTASFGSWVAEVVEVSGDADAVRIENVWIAADLGGVLDPSIVEAQLFSGAVYGLSAAMGQEITFADGMVQQSNFHDYDAMRINQCPNFEIAILSNAPKMGGAGEVGTPPAIPALANAVYALTGKRIRQLPLSREVRFA